MLEKFVFSSLLLINEILGVHVCMAVYVFCIYVWWRIGRHRVNAKVAKYFMRWEVTQSTSHTHTRHMSLFRELEHDQVHVTLKHAAHNFNLSLMIQKLF